MIATGNIVSYRSTFIQRQTQQKGELSNCYKYKQCIIYYKQFVY